MTLQPPDAPPSKKETARELVELLGETNERVLRQLERFVSNTGREFAMGIYRQALEAEANGGLFVEMKSGEIKRRSLGGVFFWLAKQAIGPDLSQKLFPSRSMAIAHNRRLRAERRAAREAAAAAAPPVEAAPVVVPAALPLKVLAPKSKAVPPPKPAKPLAAAPAKPPARPVKPEASRPAAKRRGPVKMPEVFHTVRTK